MRVAYFTDTFLPQINGVTNTLDKLGKYLHQRNINHLFLAPHYPGPSSKSHLHLLHENSNVIRFKSVPFPLYPECRLSIPLYSNMKNILDEFQPTLIHLTDPLGIGLSGLRYARERNIPIVTSFHTNFDVYLKYYKMDYLEDTIWGFFKWFHNFSQVNFCPSKDTFEVLKQKGIRNLKIWSRGVDTEKYNPIHKNESLRKELGLGSEKLFLYVGRVSAEKDLDILMESIKRIYNTYPGKASFIITGDGPLLSDLKASAPKNVVFTGYRGGNDLASLYASCDAFVFPSSTETFGNVVLEALASGLPVIGVNSGGVKDSIKHNHNGILCAPRDIESFSNGILRLIEEDSLLSSLSYNAREYTLKKSWDHIFKTLISDYEEVLLQNTVQINKLA